MKAKNALLVTGILLLAAAGGFFAGQNKSNRPVAPMAVSTDRLAPSPPRGESRSAPLVPAPAAPSQKIVAGSFDRGALLPQMPGLMPPRVAPNEPLLPGFAGPASWRNLGTATPSAAFETHCWAIDHGDVDVLLRTVNPSASSRAKLKAIFDELPAADQARYGSPERMLGMIWVYHGLPFPGFMIQSENAHSPNDTGVILQLQYNEKGADREFVFTREPDGWRKVTPDSQIDDFLAMTGISPAPRH